MRRALAALLGFLVLGLPALADPLPAGYENWMNNGPFAPVTKDGVTTFHVEQGGCSPRDYENGTGESDCINGSIKSVINRIKNVTIGRAFEYRFDVRVDPGFAYRGYYEPASAYFRPRGWDSRLRIASWEGPPFRKSFVYMVKLDTTNGITFLGHQCQDPSRFGEWVTFSMKVRWSGDDSGWVKVACDDRIVFADEAIPTNRSPQCYVQNECDPADHRNLKVLNFLLGLALNGNGYDWKETGHTSLFTEIQPDGLTIAMRNIAVTENPDLYDEADKANIRALQTALNALGCDVGVADGVVGKRTREQALACRAFPDGRMPAKLTVATAKTFLELYAGAGVAGLPPGTAPVPPAYNIQVLEDSAEKTGHDEEVISHFEGTVEGKDAPPTLGFLLLGQYFYGMNNFGELGILLDDDLGTPPPALLQCAGQRTQTWGDGSVHAVIQFVKDGNNFYALDAKCVVAALPGKVGTQARFLIDHFREIASSMVAAGADDLIRHDGVRMFINRVAAGEVRILS